MSDDGGDPLVDPVAGVPSWVPNIDDEVSLRRLRRGIWAVLAAGFLVFLVRGADRPADPTLEGTGGAATASAVPPRGFRTIEAAVVPAAGEPRTHCLLLAGAPDRVRRGLPDVEPALATGEWPGVGLRSAEPVVAEVWARATTGPLAVSFFDAGGGLIAVQPLAPCGDQDDCPRLRPPKPWAFALVSRGSAADVGVQPGARLELRGAC